jgi:hypothetical protein
MDDDQEEQFGDEEHLWLQRHYNMPTNPQEEEDAMTRALAAPQEQYWVGGFNDDEVMAAIEASKN